MSEHYADHGIYGMVKIEPNKRGKYTLRILPDNQLGITLILHKTGKTYGFTILGLGLSLKTGFKTAKEADYWLLNDWPTMAARNYDTLAHKLEHFKKEYETKVSRHLSA